MNNAYHFIGIGGIGMSGLAHLLLDRNCSVGGSDIQSNTATEELTARGASISIGHAAENVNTACTVVYTTGVTVGNPEFQAALKLGLPMLHRSDLLWQLAVEHTPIAVAGTHGKTTTSALLTMVLSEARNDPSFAVGGIIPQLGTNAKRGRGEHFVFEACESDGSFVKYTPFAAIVTNIDNDHVDHFQSEAALYSSFAEFIARVTHLFWCGDDPILRKMNPSGISYGFASDCDVRITRFQQQGWRIFFDIELRSTKFQSHEFHGRKYQQIELALQGRHNALNGAAVFALALLLGLDEDAIRRAFSSFGGVLRRLEKKGDAFGILFLDDYAHHPTEIKTTLQGIRAAIGERRLIVLYQPHRYSRTEYCQDMYAHVFDEADLLFLTDIYAAGENPIEGVHSLRLVEKIRESHLSPVEYVPHSELVSAVLPRLLPHDVVVSLGAGDIVKIGESLLAEWQKSSKKLKIALLFGGASVEHEISLLSAKNIASSLNRDFYDVAYFAISKNGKWISGPPAKQCLDSSVKSVDVPTDLQLDASTLTALLACDIVFPAIHGSFGEDGTLQGFLEILGKPYVGCDHRSAAICMDKAVTKQLMMQHAIPTLPFTVCRRKAWVASREKMSSDIAKEIGFPLFIKPAHLGSSLGVSRVGALPDLEKALESAFKLDHLLIAEKAIKMRELEFAVIGNEKVVVFPPGEVLTQGKAYDYAAKYGAAKTAITPKAALPPSILAKGKEFARSAYLAAGCSGMARIDMFLDENEEFWLNEINPIPGFTSNSLYPLICLANGFSAESLADQLIILGLERKRCHQSSFPTSL